MQGRYLVIRVEMYSGDYETLFQSVSLWQEKDFEDIKRILKLIKSKSFNNWDRSGIINSISPEKLYKDVLTEDEINLVDDLIVYSDSTSIVEAFIVDFVEKLI